MGESVNKKDLVDYISDEAGLTKKEVQSFVESSIEVMSDALVKGNKVQITGFGTFSVLKRKAKKGINPQTKKKITIPSRKVPKFKAGKLLIDGIN